MAAELLELNIYTVREQEDSNDLLACALDSIKNDGVSGLISSVAKVGEAIYAEAQGVAQECFQAVVEFLTGGKTETAYGYITKEDFDKLNVSSVSIPANFAGLEAEMVPTRLEDQLFRIYEVNENEDYVTVKARHVWYDNLQNYTLWQPTEETAYTGAAACRNVLTNAISPCGSHVASDCTSTQTFKATDFERKNIVEAYLDPENGVCARYGLSLIRDNWDFYCLKEVGYDRGFVIQNGKNLLGVERTESLENVVTRVAPFGKDADGNIVWLNNNGKKYVDSQYIGDYGYPRVEVFDTGLQVGKDDVTADNINAKLLAEAQKRFTDDKADLPEVEMEIEFLSLGDTEEYAQYRGLDKVYLYDIVTIFDTIRGYEYSAQVVGIEHDILTGMLNKITLGKIQNSDGVRKIATWQVPEISGENIRLKTILSGSFAEGAINGDDIAVGGVHWVHMDAASITQLTTEQLEALQANIHTLIAGSITADDIAAGSITTLTLAAGAVTADKISSGAITTEKLDAYAVTATKLAANAVTADKIDANDLTAINAKLGTAEIAIAAIQTADIGYARIKEMNAQSAYFGQAVIQAGVANKLFIPRLSVDYAQIVSATIGDLVIQATDDNYYKLDVDLLGNVTATQVSPTAEEIAAGHTDDGRTIYTASSITASELNTTDIYASHALIDQITAAQINVDELWANQAFINKLMVTDISSNTYITSHIGNWESGSTITQAIDSLNSRISSLGYGTIYMQPNEPSHAELVSGDIWIQTITNGTWQGVKDGFASWQVIKDTVSSWQIVGGVPIEYVWDGQRWIELYDALLPTTLETEVRQTVEAVSIMASRVDGIASVVDGLNSTVVTMQADLTVTAQQISAEVSRATTAEGGKLDKTSSYQTADSIVTAAVSQASSSAEGSYLKKTTTYQTADSIVTAAVSQAASAASGSYIAKTQSYQSADAIVLTAENYADGKASTAESNAKTYAAGQASAAETNAKNYTANNFYAIKSGISIVAAGIEISGGKYIKIFAGNTAKMILDQNGIEMNTAGKFYLHAQDSSGSAIIFGTNAASATFSVGQTGDVVAKSLTVDNLTVKGNGLPRFVISETQPSSGTNVVWIKPSSTSEKTWNFRPSSLVIDNAGGTLGYYKDFTCSYSAADYLSGSLFYGIKARLQFYASMGYENHTFKARLKNGSGWIDLGSITQTVTQWATLVLDTMLTTATTNVMSVSGGAFTIRLETDAPSSKCMLLNEDIQFKAKNTSSGAFAACSVFYKQ